MLTCQIILKDLYVDLSDLYMDLSDFYVDFSDKYVGYHTHKLMAEVGNKFYYNTAFR